MNGDGFVSALGILFCPTLLLLFFLSFSGYLEVYLLMEELIFPLAGLGTGDFKWQLSILLLLVVFRFIPD